MQLNSFDILHKDFSLMRKLFKCLFFCTFNNAILPYRWSQRILAWEQFLEVLDVIVEALQVVIQIPFLVLGESERL